MIGLDRLVTLPALPTVTRVTSSHVIVITFVLRSKQTNIHIDVKEMEGGVRATSILCLLGIGVGLGSLLIYKIYSKLFPPAITSAQTDSDTKCHHCGHTYSVCQEYSAGQLTEKAQKTGCCTESKRGHSTTNSSASSTPSTPSTAFKMEEEDLVDFLPQGKPSSTPITTTYIPGQTDARVRRRGRSHCRTDSTNSEGFLLLQPGVNRNSMCSSFSSDLGFSSGVPPDSLETLQSGSEVSYGGHLRDFKPVWFGNGDAFREFDHYNRTVDTITCSASDQGQLHIRQNRRRHLSSSSVPDCSVAPPGELRQHQHRFDAKSDLGFTFTDYADCGNLGNNAYSSPAHSNRSSDRSSRKRAAPDDSSDEDDQVFLKRQPLSFCSDISAYSEMSTRDYILCRYSVDLGEDLSGRCSPNPNLLDKEEIGTGTVNNIERIQEELSNIQQDINEMTQDVYMLRSRDNLLELDEVENLEDSLYDSLDVNRNPSLTSTKDIQTRLSPFQSFPRMSRSRSRSRSLSRTRSLSPDSFQSETDLFELQKSSQSFGDFMWDYQSDLLASTLQSMYNASMPQRFVAKRPRFSNTGVVTQVDSDSSGSRNSCDVSHVSWELGDDSPKTQSLRESPSNLSWRVDNVGRKYNVFEYAERRWRDGACCEAKAMKEGFHRLPSLLGLSHLRQVRRDHYCPLRATLYQALVNNLPLSKHLCSWSEVLKRLDVFQQLGYLQQWTFANRLPYSREQLFDKITECVKAIYDMMKHISMLDSTPSREDYLVEQLNSNPQLDLQLLEGCKILMMLHVMKLHERLLAGRGVPLFVRLLYGSEGATSPEMILKHLLNPLGDTKGMQKLEMFLLGHTLGVKIEVIRPARCHHPDYISHYPDEGADGYPKVYLIEEDESHFDVLCQ